jgi:hypothetical protein
MSSTGSGAGIRHRRLAGFLLGLCDERQSRHSLDGASVASSSGLRAGDRTIYLIAADGSGSTLQKSTLVPLSVGNE